MATLYGAISSTKSELMRWKKKKKKSIKSELQVTNLSGAGVVMKNCDLDGNRTELEIAHAFFAEILDAKVGKGMCSIGRKQHGDIPEHGVE